ncbi:MAG: lamin tail domain-containing protein [Crocinitomicaceae bacterium]
MKKSILLIFGGVISFSTSIFSQCTDLFISEYIEGSSFNKAVEIYNPTSSAIDLSDYKLQLFSSNSSTVSQEVQLSGTLNPGEVFVACHASADAAIIAQADLQSSSVINYNGDDAIALAYDPTGTSATVIDAIGSMDGNDPGTNWPVGSGGTAGSTVNNTLIRSASINQGQTNWVVGATEWEAQGNDNFSFLGSHTMTPCTPPSNPEVQFSVAAANVNENGGSITITVNIAGENANPTSADIVLLGSGTAAEGTDFTYASTSTVTFPASSSTAQTISIPILDNALVDGDLTFVLELQNLTNSATTGTNSTITVTIVDDEVPYFTISQIDDLDGAGVALSDGLECQLSGYVYGVNMRATGVQFTLHDGTGGIGVINFSSNLGYTVTEGDSIDVTGTIDQYNGYLQIVVTEINLHTQGYVLPAPAVVTALDESTESELVQINNVTIVNLADWNPAGAGFNADVTDGVNTYTMRIDAEVDLFSMMAPDGTFDLVGIGGQFDSSTPFDAGYQLLPRYNNDIHIKPMIIGGDQTICPGDSLTVDYSNVTYLWNGTNATSQTVVADTAGTYAVAVTYGTVTAMTSAVVTLTTDIPDAGFTASSISVCDNVDITITDTSINANSISIDFGDGNSTTTSPAVHQYASPNTYTVSLAATSLFGCVDSATVQITVNDCASIEENQSIEMKLFPNPSNGIAQLTTNAQGTYDLKILDLTGQVLKTIKTSNQIVQIDLSNQPSGIYFVKLVGDKANQTIKFVKK